MVRPNRSELVDPNEIGVYHCIPRCVRRARLCGVDRETKRDYGHRKLWMEDRLRRLAEFFAIDVLNHALLSNHCHIILRNRPDVVKKMSRKEVARRWCCLCPPRRVKKDQTYEPTEADLNIILNDAGKLAACRERLSSLSWFMKLLAEPLARMANKEDNCRGHFWEARFTSVKLTDEASLLACAAYVDLNPIRAAIAECLELSHFTSVKLRIEALRNKVGGPPTVSELMPDHWLAPVFLDERIPQTDHPEPGFTRCSDRGYLPMTFEQYLTLLEWTAVQSRSDKPGSMPLEMLGTLKRLGIESEANWIELATSFKSCFSVVAGCRENRRHEYARMGRKRQWHRRESLITSPA